MNSIVAFEGLVRFASQLPRAAWQSSVFGCFDRDPFAARLPFDITTMRQDVEAIIPEAFALADGPIATTLPAPP
jgi:LacI family fructose operon transcriptional repressor